MKRHPKHGLSDADPGTVPPATCLAARRAGGEGVFFRDVLRMYDKRSTVMKTEPPPQRPV